MSCNLFLLLILATTLCNGIDLDRQHNDRNILDTLQTAGTPTIGGIYLPSHLLNFDTILVFGGFGFSSGNPSGQLNDMWQYRMSTNQWTWLTGSKARYPLGSYTTAPLFPGGRMGMPSWQLSSGDMLVYGGLGFATSGASQGYLNDLWRYFSSNNTWNFLGGSSALNSVGQFGTKGVPSTSNLPPARALSVYWQNRLSQDAWLFGGRTVGSNNLNDLWRYNPTTREWTWISGSSLTNQLGVYGTQTLGSDVTIPGAREVSVSWTDECGNFWMFGGYGFSSTSGKGTLNDLWRYNRYSNRWAWMKGSVLTDQTGSLGTKNVSSPSNAPGARYDAMGAVDPQGDYLWLFGGSQSFLAPAYRNDLWRYRISTNEWTWISGNQTAVTNGVYGTQGVPSTRNYPEGRGGAVMWIAQNGDVWIVGGFASLGIKNDVWRYRPSTDEWTWISGAMDYNRAPVY